MPRSPDSFVIHSFYARFLLDYVRAKGGDVEALGQRFSLPSPTDEAPTLAISLGLLRDLSQAAEQMLGDPSLGLHVACALGRGSYGIFELAVRSAPTMRDALDRIVRYAGRIVSRAELFAFESTEEGGLLVHRLPAEAMRAARHQSEFTLVSTTLVCRQLAGEPAWTPLRLTFSHPAPADRGELTRVFGAAPIEFDRPYNSILFDREMLDAPVKTTDPEVLPILDHQARLVIRLLEAEGAAGDEGFVEQVRRAVRRGLGDGDAGIVGAARVLRMSPRTLQRRLSAAGTSFAALVDELRLELARRYLDAPRSSLAEIAARLGYSDERAFVRAFKGWTGLTPGRYRRDKAS